jgi:hypothetical protein
MYGVAEAAYLLGDADVASETYRLLAPYGNLPIIASIGVACFGSVEHACGISALAKGDTVAAIEHLRRAVRRNRALGHWPAATLSRYRLGHALAASSHVGEQAQAHREQRSARRTLKIWACTYLSNRRTLSQARPIRPRYIGWVAIGALFSGRGWLSSNIAAGWVTLRC